MPTRQSQAAGNAIGASDAHIAWCAAHYANYSAETDTFVGYDGVTYRCPAPY